MSDGLYQNKIFCSSDCVNTECYRYYDQGVAKDASDSGLTLALSDWTKSCPYYTAPKRKKDT